MTLDLIRLPKAELHLHIEGTLEPETVLELADTNGVRLPFADEDALRAAYDFANLQEFLDLYYAAMATVVTADDFYTMTARYYERAAAQGVRHAEIFLDPQAHLSRGVRWEVMMDGVAAAVADAERRHGITGGIIACILRDRPVAEALATYESIRADRDRFLGIGLDSAELPYPPELFADLWQQAKRDGFKVVAHAGEEGPAAYIWTALDALGVDRVDHGIRAVDDPALVGVLAERRVPLTVCPLSNVALKTVPDLGHHPLLTLLEQDVVVTVNSDDPAYFGGYVGENYLAMRVAGMTDAQAVRLAHHSVDASFADADRKAALHAEIDAFAG
nr:adenosine deaminase [Propionibacterium sp.]